MRGLVVQAVAWRHPLASSAAVPTDNGPDVRTLARGTRLADAATRCRRVAGAVSDPPDLCRMTEVSAVRRTPPRLYLGAAALLTLVVGRALLVQAPPSHLFHAQTHPAYGSASIFIAAVAVALASRTAGDGLDRLGNHRTAPWWIAGALTVYGASLLILELFTRISHAGLDTEFQRGHTAVSAFWGGLGLMLLYVGLKKGWRSLRVAGLVFFAVSLTKIFLYDLPSLSSVTRALSFLAVGAVLLLGGFFYQRLTTDRDKPSAVQQ
jgi:hypothetical protein